MQRTRVGIIWAGPLGLVPAAHLSNARVDFCISGTVMQFWREMPRGTLLRSEWDGAHLPDSGSDFNLDAFERARHAAHEPHHEGRVHAVRGLVPAEPRAGSRFTPVHARRARRHRLRPHVERRRTDQGRPSVRWVHGLTDTAAALEYVRAGELTPSGYLRSFRPAMQFAIFAQDDPLPWIGDVPLIAARHWRSQRRSEAATASPAGC